MPASLTDVAYAAGLFDGEGHISIAYSACKKTRRNGRIWIGERWQMNCSMSQNDGRPIKWLVEKFGGSCRQVTGKRSYSDNRYRRWNWVLASAQAARFLATVQPFLIVKAEEAEIALEFYGTVRPSGSYGRSRIPIEIREKRVALTKKIRDTRNALKVACAS